MNTIYFYSKNEEYGELSNFAPFGIEMNGVWWPTVEHYFQAQKFNDRNYQERIRTAQTPKQASELGRLVSFPLSIIGRSTFDIHHWIFTQKRARTLLQYGSRSPFLRL